MALGSARLLLDLVFPPRCVGCASAGAPICAACGAAVHAPEEPLCGRCGHTLPRPAGRIDASMARACPVCASGHTPVTLTGLRAAAVYEGVVRAAVLALKHRGQRRLAEPLGDLLAATTRQAFPATELIVPIPLHAARRRQRGYNQAELLARRCASSLRIPSDARILSRHRATVPQVGLSATDRRANVAGAFTAAGMRSSERQSRRL
jgi:predicted amidophosphoribosyltransferase